MPQTGPELSAGHVHEWILTARERADRKIKKTNHLGKLHIWLGAGVLVIGPGWLDRWRVGVVIVCLVREVHRGEREGITMATMG